MLTRRTRISIETVDRGRAAAEPVAQAMGELLGWSGREIRREATHYLERLDAEMQAARAPDDEHADAARSPVRDPRLVA